MFKMILLNIIFDAVYVTCVTTASIHFEKPALLWWYLLVLFTGFSIKTKKGDAE